MTANRREWLRRLLILPPLALGIALSGIGVAGIILPPLIQHLIPLPYLYPLQPASFPHKPLCLRRMHRQCGM